MRLLESNYAGSRSDLVSLLEAGDAVPLAAIWQAMPRLRRQCAAEARSVAIRCGRWVGVAAEAAGLGTRATAAAVVAAKSTLLPIVIALRLASQESQLCKRVLSDVVHRVCAAT